MNDDELLYAETARCHCGAGLAYPLDHVAAMKNRAWDCSRVLRGEVPPSDEHDSYPFAFYGIREETSINGGGATTRQAGTVALTVGSATCPKCQHKWESEPYVACGAGHHWFSGPCPKCGYAVGGEGIWRSDEGEPIDCRYRTVVLSDTDALAKKGP